jgi:hypothetical protein
MPGTPSNSDLAQRIIGNEDAGESAFQAIFELSLGDLAMDFLARVRGHSNRQPGLFDEPFAGVVAVMDAQLSPHDGAQH